MDYRALAYYIFTPIADPLLEVKRQKECLRALDGRARIYISEQGINGQLSLHKDHVEAYAQFLHADERFRSVEIKLQECKEHAFAKLTVKVRRELVAVDRDIDLSKRGAYLTPSEWKEKMESRDEHTIIIDVRNRYESKVGHFEGAILPDIDTFREFPDYAKALAQQVDTKKTHVMMYCTGGIRCELYSALMKEVGFDTVYQLKGGVVQYGLDEGKEHWRGKLFVFDDRMVVPISEDNQEIISHCQRCGAPSDTYYNCANVDCNQLFLACSDCILQDQGCCQASCTSGRVRAFSGKPFRKMTRQEKACLL